MVKGRGLRILLSKGAEGEQKSKDKEQRKQALHILKTPLERSGPVGIGLFPVKFNALLSEEDKLTILAGGTLNQ